MEGTRNRRAGTAICVAATAFFVVLGMLTGKSGKPDAPLAREEPRAERSAGRDLGVSRVWRERFLFLRAALDWLGTPYRYGGRTREGADCSGFVSAAVAETFDGIGAVPRTAAGLLRFGRSAGSVGSEVVLPGDILVFSKADMPVHAGIALSGTMFVHSASEGVTGVTISSLDEPYWKSYHVFIRRFLPRGGTR